MVDKNLDEELNRIERVLDMSDRKLLEVETEALSLNDPKLRDFVKRYG